MSHLLGARQPRYWPTAKAYRALGLEPPAEVVEADTEARKAEIVARRERRRG